MATSGNKGKDVNRTGKWWPLLTMLLALLPSLAVATLEVGELVVHSAPGEPLRASIPIGLPEDLHLASLRFSLADEETYRQQGLARPVLLNDLRIALLARGEQRARVQLFASAPWRGEALDLLLQLRYPGMEQLLGFAIQPIATTDSAEYIVVGPDETLDSVALRLADRHNRSYLHMMYALYQANPEAFYRDNMNNLRGGSRLRLPDNEELYRFDDAEAFGAIRAHQQRWQNAPREPVPPAGTDTDHLDLERDRTQLLHELQQVSAEESRFVSQNQALREQLAELESRVSQIGAELFAEPAPQPAPQPTSTPAPPVKSKATDQSAPEEAGTTADTAPAWPFLLLLVTILFVGIALHFYLQQRTRSRL